MRQMALSSRKSKEGNGVNLFFIIDEVKFFVLLSMFFSFLFVAFSSLPALPAQCIHCVMYWPSALPNQ